MNLKLFNYCKSKLAISFLICALSLGFANAQNINISGNVVAEGLPLPGVSILVKGTNQGAVTDFDGNFTINAASNAVLVFSYLGYETQEVSVNGRTSVNVTLQTDLSTLDEVVVVGYGVQKKKVLTGSVGQVKAEVLEKVTTADLGTALQGQIAGVNVSASSGEPGAASNILIRGFSSLQDGQNSPLYVVDGIPFDDDPQLSISEIETIDVLKDAASTAIYGVRGASGVILITTKQGKVGQMSIRVNSEYGFQDILSDFDLMSPEEYSYFHLNEASIRSNKVEGGVEIDIHRNPTNFTNNSSLKNVLLNDLAPIQNHSINVSGGNEGLTYNFNANYFGQEGILFNSGLDRFNIRSNVQFTKGKWKVITGLALRRDQRKVGVNQIMNRILGFRPFNPEVNLDTNSLTNASAIDVDDPDNDWKLGEARRIANTARTLKTEDKRNLNNHTANIQVEFDATKNLKLTGRFGATYADEKRVRKVPRFDVFNNEGRLISNPDNITSQRITDLVSSKLTSEQFLTFNKQFGKHNLTLLAGFSYEKSTREQYQLEVRNNLNPAVTVLDNYELMWEIESGGNDFVRTLIGKYARAQYDFDGKYLFTGIIRRDGSSQFSKENRWGIFPSVSAGWNISDEPFWEPLKNTINQMKMRISYGSNGNDRFDAYSNQTVVETGIDYVFGSSTVSPDIIGAQGDQTALGTTQLRYANATLGWETNVEQNLGFDLGFFKNKLTVTTEYYKSEKRDLLYEVVNPPSTGVSGNQFRSTVFNVGNMENTGVEYTANYRHRGKKGLRWNIGATYTSNNNRVTQTSLNNPIIYLENSYISDAGTRELVSVITEGYEAAAFFLRETDGVIKTEEELTAYREIDPSAQLGEFRYVDQNGDGAIDDNDRVYSGSGTPDWEAGLNFSANYKGFDFTMQWYGAFGAEIMNGSKAYSYQVGTHKDLFYTWSKNNPTSDLPWWNGANSRSYRGASAYFLEDGDFIRLRNVSLGYSLPKDFLESLGFSKFRIYVQAQNPLTITDYSGFDPEVGGNGLSTRGIDRGTYPLSSQYKVGLQLQF
ncbi:TonB-dependent receptor [Seonamhaeicola sp.]|uniref:SusC/RagA family TonB-linked outer membrane protein n=1 Tax=Seonamhaeicola sp. TaxID=1912245 RepID=UPI002637690E|nr:TonB-dependent receptor [Seonamhaeicola sp.]